MGATAADRLRLSPYMLPRPPVLVVLVHHVLLTMIRVMTRRHSHCAESGGERLKMRDCTAPVFELSFYALIVVDC